MKKKTFSLGLVGFAAVIGLLILGCDVHGIDAASRTGETADEEMSNPIAELQSAPDTSKVAGTYKKIVGLQLGYAQKGVETVSAYIDIPEAAGRSADSGTVDFESIGKLLPDDLSTLKRIKPASDRSAEGEEITLEEELNILIEDFSAELEAALPNPEKALTLDFVEGTDEGLLIGGDTVIPYNSLEGAVTVELLNALADGENLEEIITGLEAEIQDIFGGSVEDLDRGIVKASDRRWAKGVLNYCWGSISSVHKAAVEEAMRTWTDRTGGEVKFSKLSFDAWTLFQLGIRAIGVIAIYDTSLPDDIAGRATVGYQGGFASLELQYDISGDQLKRTALHELGHCIGLRHEHQRYDRDEWISVSSNESSYAIIPKNITSLHVEWLRVRIGWWTISIPYPCVRQQTNSTVYGPFDFESVMLYSTNKIKVRKVPTGSKTVKEGKVPPYNTDLSYWDVETVKRIY
ncbi:MAG: hypothetical protein LBK61_03380 [Spirochaetaceae bacterium]|jgi:hypothetical protein|nr:hypothetical protein [Spirochaetaceae bacterium]